MTKVARTTHVLDEELAGIDRAAAQVGRTRSDYVAEVVRQVVDVMGRKRATDRDVVLAMKLDEKTVKRLERLSGSTGVKPRGLLRFIAVAAAGGSRLVEVMKEAERVGREMAEEGGD